MKKLLVTLLFIGMLSPSVFAGGIVTNANQSAAYVRMLARDASTSIDAVYYNPAGLTRLADGFHLSLTNQSIFQKKTIENKFPYLNESKYVGDVAAPFFPSIYAVYKKDKLALSFGFNPNAGGGSADYQTGLPSFEIPISMIPVSLSLKNIPTNKYSADVNFKGTSVFWGAQVNASYAVNEFLSVSLGVRAIFAKNTYKGYLKNIMINPNYPLFGSAYNGTSLVSAPQFFTDAATFLHNSSVGSASYSTGLTSFASSNPTTPLNDLPTLPGSPFTTDDVNNMKALIVGAGQSATGINIATAKALLAGVAPGYQKNSDAMTANAVATTDKDVDAEQTGTGYTPILGANININEKINIAFKYEFRTKLILENKTKIDGTGMFVDGAKIRSDIPSILSIGIGYNALPQLRLSSGIHYYFDNTATIEKSPGVKKDIEGNLYEIALGGEFDITDKILISAGYLYAKTGVGQGYQTDLSHSLTSNTVGFGGAFKATEKMQINLGMLYTMYSSDSKNVEYSSYGLPSAYETYNRTNIVFSVGVDYHF